MSRKLKHHIQLPIYFASKRFLEFDEWCDMFADEIDIELAESGADREMDFSVESEYKKQYEMYLNENQQHDAKLLVIGSVCHDCLMGRDEFEPEWKCPDCRRQTDL